MVFYFALNILLLLFALIDIYINNRTLSKYLFGISVFILFVLSFIRWETGTDWYSYYEMYTWTYHSPWILYIDYEPGFVFVENLGRVLFDHYTGVLFIFAIIIYVCTYKAYCQLCNHPMVALWLSFCITFANMLFVRQNIALAILSTSIVFAYKRKFLPFFLIVFIASLFHRTACAFLIIYPLFNIVFKKKTILILMGIFIVLGIIMSNFILNLLSGYLSDAISQKIDMYVELGTDDNSTVYSVTQLLIKGFVNRFFLLCIFLFTLKQKELREQGLLNGLFNTYIIGTILYIILLPLSISLARVAVYMDIVQIFIITYILYLPRKRFNRLILFGIFAGYYMVRFYVVLESFKGGYIPYKTIFS